MHPATCHPTFLHYSRGQPFLLWHILLDFIHLTWSLLYHSESKPSFNGQMWSLCFWCLHIQHKAICFWCELIQPTDQRPIAPTCHFFSLIFLLLRTIYYHLLKNYSRYLISKFHVLFYMTMIPQHSSIIQIIQFHLNNIVHKFIF